MGILLYLFFVLVWSFSIYSWAFFFFLFSFAVILTLWNVIMDKKSYCISQINLFLKIFLNRNKYFMTSNIDSNIAYYYTLYSFVCLTSKNSNLLSHYNISFSNIYFNHLWLIFKLVLQTVTKWVKGFAVEVIKLHCTSNSKCALGYQPSLLLKNTTLLSCKAPPPPPPYLNLQTVQAPLFRQSPSIYWFFVTTLKIWFLHEP